MSNETEIYTVARTEQGAQGGVIQSAGVGLWTRESIYMPASEFKRYDDALPGAAERLLTLFEEQARHRMAVEPHQVQSECESQKIAIEADQSNRTRAARFGLSALLIFVALAVFFALLGMESAAIAAVLVPAIQCIGDWIGKLARGRNSGESGSR